jgi:hypothetical protein
LGNLLAFVIDSPTPIKELPHLDPGLGIGSPPGTWGDIDANPTQPDGVVISHGSFIAKRAYPIDINPPRQGAPGLVWFLRGAAKLPVMGLQKALQEEIGLLDICDTTPFEFCNEPILEGSKQSLDPSLGLRGKGIDGLDTKLFESPSHLGGILPASKLLFHSPVAIVAFQRTVPILVDGKGDPILLEHLP